jgi:large subunit ribosomal protein L6
MTMLPRSIAFKRTFSTSQAQLSHIGKKPIIVPTTVTFDFPPLSISPNGKRILNVLGPLGTQSIVLLPPVILSPPSSEVSSLSITVHDATKKPHKRAWGLTRTLIHNAVVGVSEGYTVELRLVGVGYRAAIEPIPDIFRKLQSLTPRVIRPRRPGAPPEVEKPLPVDRLNIKLGFSHPVLIDIPVDIKVTVPQPTKILLKGTDKQALGQFAAKIRAWRKPEPYRGKVSVRICVD